MIQYISVLQQWLKGNTLSYFHIRVFVKVINNVVWHSNLGLGNKVDFTIIQREQVGKGVNGTSIPS